MNDRRNRNDHWYRPPCSTTGCGREAVSQTVGLCDACIPWRHNLTPWQIAAGERFIADPRTFPSDKQQKETR